MNFQGWGALIVEKGEFVLEIVNGRLDPFVRHLEKVNVLFDTNKLTPEVDAGDARRAGTHERIQNGSSFRAGNPDQTFQQFNRLLARVQTVYTWDRRQVPNITVHWVLTVKIPEVFVFTPEVFVFTPETERFINGFINFFGGNFKTTRVKIMSWHVWFSIPILAILFHNILFRES